MNKPPHSLQALPSVAAVLRHGGVPPLVERCGRAVVVGWIREELDAARRELREKNDEAGRAELLDAIAARLAAQAGCLEQTRFGPVINATGVVLHTGLGRAPLSAAARAALEEAAGTANVEIDLASGERRSRGHQLLEAWRTLSGCEDAVVVNNNAAATLLTLQALCAGREVVISRGQLIEIGGSFRLPDIFALSGAKLKEVGTTNRTRPADYEAAIGPETAAVMHVHPSNYRVVGFAESPGIAELAPLARRHGVLA
ncbi:MAG: L-seryl-tRNA(Sec) selenium transferase, partial [Planctomycetaceae bacterium]